MIGIVSFGAYVPFNRLPRKKLEEAFGNPAAPGNKAVANYDEDSLTMAVASSLDCLSGLSTGDIKAVYFASTTSPYREKSVAATISEAIALCDSVRTLDFAGSLRVGSGAMLAALDAVKTDMGRVLVTSSDCRLGAAGGQWEQFFGDGAASFLLGSDNVIAAYECSHSISADIQSLWRGGNDPFVRSWEERFYITKGYNSLVTAAVDGLLEKADMTPADISRLILYAPSPRYQAALAGRMGFQPGQVQDCLFNEIGNTGSASAPMMLASALETAKAGDKLLLVTFGEGADAILFTVTEDIGQLPKRKGVSGHIDSKTESMTYEKYLNWRNLISMEPPRRPAMQQPSAPAMYRNRKQKLSFYGSRCLDCQTPQYPPQRICVNCRSKDRMEDYSLLDKKAKIKTYTVDHLTNSQDPPITFVVVDFEGGGRVIFEMTDCVPGSIDIGTEVDFTFRKLFEAGGISNYYWKAAAKR